MKLVFNRNKYNISFFLYILRSFSDDVDWEVSIIDR